jgi:hypothetical protein
MTAILGHGRHPTGRRRVQQRKPFDVCPGTTLFCPSDAPVANSKTPVHPEIVLKTKDHELRKGAAANRSAYFAEPVHCELSAVSCERASESMLQLSVRPRSTGSMDNPD